MNKILFGDNLSILQGFDDEIATLAYIDPPFNTGKERVAKRIKTTESTIGDRVGFGGRRFKTALVSVSSFNDIFSSQLEYHEYLTKRIAELWRILTQNGSIFIHLDYREVHYIKVLMDSFVGHECFMNEIIWSYDYGGRPRNRWPNKHDTILWYAKDPENYIFNFDEIDRIPYMAPNLVGAEKAERGKTPTDVWWNTIVPTNGNERTGYPTQKPLSILNRLVRVHSNPCDIVIDAFAGSGTTGEAAGMNGRKFILIDNNPEAIQVMKSRLHFYV